MVSVLEAKESPLEQTSDEIIAYSVDATGWTSTPSSPSVAVFDEDDGSDVTATVMPTNSPSVSGATITLSPLRSLTAGRTYRVEVKFGDGGSNTFEMYFRVICPL
ncbi:MAG: hypothetical protein L0177_11860 [Chloroflexi bacterium]|nr:hypothetical protein [Chloroflexota bacterium]